MNLLVGLGNPGLAYSAQRHNVGFMFLDALARAQDLPPPRDKFRSKITIWQLAERKVVLLRPQTFMNHSGLAVREAVDFFKLAPEQVCVVHDDLDLPFLKVRYKVGGGNAGHKGLASVDAHIGTNYGRLRIGIGRPEYKEDVNDYVLQPFYADEAAALQSFLQTAVRHAELLVGADPKQFLSVLQAEKENDHQ